VAVTSEGAVFTTADGAVVERHVDEVDWDDEAAEKGGYETFMLKEIYEQPDAVEETIGDRIRHGRLELDNLGLTDEEIRNLRRIVFVACGTAYHAGVVARYVIEEWARVPVEHEIASEWRYRNPVLSKDTLVIGISQSGETADTLAAMRIAQERGATVLALTNIMGSQATRDADGVLYTRAGLEIGVAATKTFVSQVVAMYLLALRLAELRGTLDDRPEECLELVAHHLLGDPHVADDGAHAGQVACGCGQQAHYPDHRPKQWLTVRGSLQFDRAYEVCPDCHKGQSPRDRELDVEGVGDSPGVRRMMAAVGSESSFEQSRHRPRIQ
jgi:glucosamine--fructose-6-phosphate aminotransferase (isomerizing)